MPIINTQKQFQQLRKLDFCYLCGAPIDGSTPIDHDHVPPKAMFNPADRTPPLKLPVHRSCNVDWAVSDEKMGQLLAFQSGLIPRPEQVRLNISGHEDPTTGARVVALQDLDVRGHIKRCIRGFHAALYGQFLPKDTQSSILPPLPEGKLEADGIFFEGVPQCHYEFAHFLKRCRVVQTVDQLVAYNGKCLYECAWAKADDGELWLCIFGLQIYNWIEIADKTPGEIRGCVGCYWPEAGKPSVATVGTQLEFTVPQNQRLNPFEANI